MKQLALLLNIQQVRADHRLKGHTYLIDNTANVGSHPLQIRTSNGGSAFTTGVTENYNSTTGLTQFIVPHEPSDTSLVYQCTNHSAMVGNITIV